MQSNDDGDEILEDNYGGSCQVDQSRMKLDVDEYLRKNEGNFELVDKTNLSMSATNAPNINKLIDESASENFSYSSEIDRMYELMTSGSKSVHGLNKFNPEIRRDFDKYKLIMMDISPTVKGKIYKKNHRAGVGEIVPPTKLVKFHYSLFVENQDEPFDSSRLRNRTKKVKLGDGGLLPGLNIAIGSMKLWELSDFIIDSEYAFKEIGCPPRVPPNCEILAEIELLEWTDDDDPIDTMTIAEKEKLSVKEVYEYVLKKLDSAKIFFANGKTKAACNRYNEARLQLEMLPVNLKDNEKGDLETLRFRVYKNLALCYIKLDLLDQASSTLEILELTNADGDVKVLYLRTKILFKQGNYVEALRKARLAQNVAPTNTDFMRLIIQIERSKAEYEKKSKEQAVRMFAKPSGDQDHPKLSGVQDRTPSGKLETIQENNLSDNFKEYVDKIVEEFIASDKNEHRFERYSFTECELLYIEKVATENNINLEACDLEVEGCYMKLIK